MKQYIELVEKILTQGIKKEDRTGTGTLSVLGHTMRFNLQEGFPLLWLKKTNFESLAHEMLWFLGVHRNKYPYNYLDMTNIKYLVDRNVNIWNDWPYKKFREYYESKGFSVEDYHNFSEEEYEKYRYNTDLAITATRLEKKARIPTQKEFADRIKTKLEFAVKWGNLGPVYGKQWREWEVSRISKGRLDQIIDTLFGISTGEMTAEAAESLLDDILNDKKNRKSIDQVKNVITQLNLNPWDRGIKISAWNVSDLKDMALRPCHYDMQFYVTPAETNKLSMILNIRSNDIGLGNPFNVAQYALLLTMIAYLTRLEPYELIVNIGDAHIYLNHVDGMKEVLRRWKQEQHFRLPKLKINSTVKDIDEFTFNDFTLLNYEYHPRIKLPVAV